VLHVWGAPHPSPKLAGGEGKKLRLGGVFPLGGVGNLYSYIASSQPSANGPNNIEGGWEALPGRGKESSTYWGKLRHFCRGGTGGGRKAPTGGFLPAEGEGSSQGRDGGPAFSGGEKPPLLKKYRGEKRKRQRGDNLLSEGEDLC